MHTIIDTEKCLFIGLPEDGSQIVLLLYNNSVVLKENSDPPGLKANDKIRSVSITL